MIKCDKGKLSCAGSKPQLISEATVLLKYMIIELKLTDEEVDLIATQAKENAKKTDEETAEELAKLIMKLADSDLDIDTIEKFLKGLK